MIRLSMSLLNPGAVPAGEFDHYVKTRHLRLLRRMEGVRRITLEKVLSAGPEAVPGAGQWLISAWWDDDAAISACLRGASGLAVLGDRMVSGEGPIPAKATVTTVAAHRGSEAGFDPRPPSPEPVFTLAFRGPGELPGDRRAACADAGLALDGAIAATVFAGHPASYPVGYVIDGVDPPAIPAPGQPCGDTVEVRFADRQQAAASLAGAAGAAFLELAEQVGDERSWHATYEPFFSVPVAPYSAARGGRF